MSIKRRAVEALEQSDDAEAERIVRDLLSVELTRGVAENWLKAERQARAEGKRPPTSH